MKFQDMTFEPNTHHEICQLIQKITHTKLSFNKVNYIIRIKKADEEEEEKKKNKNKDKDKDKDVIQYDNFYN